MNTLRSKMQDDMILRGLSPRTQQHYIAAVAGLAAHYHRSPDALSQDEVQHYLLHLIEESKLAWSSSNQKACALRFFYHVRWHGPTPVSSSRTGAFPPDCRTSCHERKFNASSTPAPTYDARHC